MIPYHKDPARVAQLNRAPRCQHIRLNGRGCGSPALHGESLCYFHDRALRLKDSDYRLPLVEDATSLLLAISQILRLLQSGHANYKECGLMLYGLQIAGAHLKGFMAEHPEFALEPGKKTTPQSAAGEKQTKGKDDESLAGMLLRLLAQPETADDDDAPPIHTPEDYYAALERRRQLDAEPPTAPSEQ